MAYSYSEVLKKKQEYEKALSVKPNAFTSSFAALRDDILNKISTREDFSYNPATDPVYNHYKQYYRNEGQRALKNTMAEASTLSGGALNSYAVTAAEESYNREMEKVGEILPELYDVAYKRYSAEGDKMGEIYSYYNALVEGEEAAYEKEWDNYYKNLSALKDAYETAEDSYNAAVALYKKANETEKTKTDSELKSSQNVKKFKNSLMKKTDYLKSAKRHYYKSYDDYVSVVLNVWYNNNQLTLEERDYLRKSYGV